MSRVRSFFKTVGDWLFVGKRLPLLIVAVVLIAASVTVSIVYSLNKKPDEYVTVYVTVKGLGDKDFENRQIKVIDGDALGEIFSLKYEKIYNDFGQPFVHRNEFYSFLGVKKTDEKSFHVTIDGRYGNNLENAYVYGEQTVVISYY